MYIAYGWPKVLRPRCAADDGVVHISHGGGFMLVVRKMSIEVWTAGQVGTHVSGKLSSIASSAPCLQLLQQPWLIWACQGASWEYGREFEHCG